jgi:hypothetical protein
MKKMSESMTSKRMYRSVLVQPKAARREALILLGAIALVTFLMGVRFSMIRSKDTHIRTLSYQINNLNLKFQAPVMYRALLGVVADVVALREKAGYWPDIDTLRDEVLPPFASGFLPNGLRGFAWERHEGTGWVDYFGFNAAAVSEKKEGGDPLENSFILRIIDLQSVEHPHPHFGKDTNERTRFTAQIWMNPKTVDYPKTTFVECGWKWIVAKNTTDEDVLSEKAGQ